MPSGLLLGCVNLMGGIKMNINKLQRKSMSSKFKFFVASVLIVLGGVTAGCATPPSPAAFAEALPFKEVKITAVGYGASSSYEGYTPGQKRLMAMRTSKLDAYRALAEQVQGVRVTGNSTVSSMMAQVDSFRVFVDAYIRGAQVVTVTPMNDGNYETTMELTLDSRFFNSFAQQMKNAPQPIVVGSNIKGAAGPGFAYGTHYPGAAYGTDYYYSE